MVRTFCSGIYLQLMIVMCFKKTSNIWRWSFISGWQRFWWCFPPKCNYDSVADSVLINKSRVLLKCGEMDASARKVLLRSVFKTRFFSFIIFKINKVLNISQVIIVLCLAVVLKAWQKGGKHLIFGTWNVSIQWLLWFLEYYCNRVLSFHHYYYWWYQ